MPTIRILLVDDHEVVRSGLSKFLLVNKDMELVGEASDGAEAIQLAGLHQPDIILMDLFLPGMDGITATREIHQICPGVRIVILSMYATSEHIYQSLRAGARGYLLKESAGAEVMSAVRAVHAGKRYLSQKITETVVDDYTDPKRTVAGKGPLESLSPREREVLQMVVEGKSSAEIADILFISPKTVETYRSRLMQKLAIDDLPTLTKFAFQHGLIHFDV